VSIAVGLYVSIPNAFAVKYRVEYFYHLIDKILPFPFFMFGGILIPGIVRPVSVLPFALSRTCCCLET
jgi:hypothetical protein